MSDSEEDEYNNTGIVYDSENSDEDFDSEDEELVKMHYLQPYPIIFLKRAMFFYTAYVCKLIWNWSQHFNLLLILRPRPGILAICYNFFSNSLTGHINNSLINLLT